MMPALGILRSDGRGAMVEDDNRSWWDGAKVEEEKGKERGKNKK